MQTNNKIKAHAHEIEVESAQFQQFVNALKEHRPTKLDKPQPQPHTHSVAYYPINSEQESSPISKELYSQGSRSLYLNTNRTPEHVSVNFGGDETLKNKGRVGVANRYAVKQYQLPPQYFTPAKLKLQQFLKDSRILPHAESTNNSRVGGNNQKGEQVHKQVVSSGQSRLAKQYNRAGKMSELSSQVILKYCIAYELTQHSQAKQIQQFFAKMLQVLDYVIAGARIEKYRECIYFGKGTMKRQIGQGFLYFYSGSIYFGQLLQHYMHGYGTQVYFNNGTVLRGQFKEGCFIGNQGKSIKQSNVKNQHSFRIRGASQQKAQYQQPQTYHYHKNKSFNDQFYYQQDLHQWALPQRTSRNRKSKPHSHFSDMIEFSYPFGNQLSDQQQSKQHKVHRKTNQHIHNPQNTRHRSSLQKQHLRQMAYMNRVRPIREQPDLNQQQPLQLKC